MQSNIVHRLLWGGVLIAVGIVFLLNQLGIATISIGDLFRNFWPIILIVVGLQGMLIQRSGGYLWNMIVMLVGIVFLGRNLDLFEWELRDLFSLIGPVVLILFGLGMMTRGARTKRPNREEERHGYGWNPVTPPMPGQPAQPEQSDTPLGPPPAPPLSDDPNAPFSDESGDVSAAGERNHADEYASRNSGHEEGAQSRQANYGDQRWESNRDPYMRAGERVRERMNRQADRMQERMSRHEEHWRRHQERREQRKACSGHNSWWNYDPNAAQHSRFIGDVHIGQDYWELRPMNISHFIGDTTIDLTKAQIPLGETKIYVSCFIGDVKVFVPGDANVGVQVVSSSLIGDVRVWDQKRGGLFNSMSVESPFYADTDKRVVLVASAFIGDVRVTKVG